MNANAATCAALWLLGLTLSAVAAAGPPRAQAPGAKLDLLISRLVTCPPAHRRFVDNGDGTICDSRTGLMWEKKNAADGVPNNSNPHDVDNVYTWSSAEDGDHLNPDGTAFTDFLAKLNGEVAQFVESEQLGGHRDWRLPTLAELQTLHPRTCGAAPCVAHRLLLPTAPFLYWSSTSLPRDFIGPVYAWGVFFSTIGAIDVDKTIPVHVRAVRDGR